MELFVLDGNKWNYLTDNKTWSQACLKMLSTKCV